MIQNPTLQTIQERRSIRRYRPDMPDRDKIEAVIEAGRCAPSGGNTQTTRFTVITNQTVLEKLQALAIEEFAKMEYDEHTYGSLRNAIRNSRTGHYPMLFGAPVLVLVSNLRTYANNYSDCACALENMMLAACSVGLGACWVNQFRWLSDNPVMMETLHEVCHIPPEEKVCGGMVMGIADIAPKKPAVTGYPVTWVE